jgi:hypothetical protein
MVLHLTPAVAVSSRRRDLTASSVTLRCQWRLCYPPPMADMHLHRPPPPLHDPILAWSPAWDLLGRDIPAMSSLCQAPSSPAYVEDGAAHVGVAHGRASRSLSHVAPRLPSPSTSSGRPYPLRRGRPAFAQLVLLAQLVTQYVCRCSCSRCFFGHPHYKKCVD